MRTYAIAWLISLAAVGSGWAQAPVPPPGNLITEEVLVTGEHPGPGLWKVSKGDHVLWILGTHAPLPKGLVWHSQEVEFVMTEAQEVLGSYTATFSIAGVDPFESKGKTLRRLLSRKNYSQWLVLKKKYIGSNQDVEKALPVTAALFLRSSAFDKTGLTNSDQVWREIYKLAHDYRVPVNLAHQVNKLISSDALDDAKKQRIGVDFLLDTMTNLEAELRAARARANAWAVGDVAALKMQAQADSKSAYLYASSWPFLQDSELQALRAETDKRWIDAAESALARNRTTFTALPIFLILRSDGLLSELKAKGFVIEEPMG